MIRFLCLFLLACAALPGGTAAADTIAWQPWSDAVFERARRENRLVLLDLEAIWCHWCHVMDGTTHKDPRNQRAERHDRGLRQARVVTVITSTDSQERAAEAKAEWGLPNLTVGYGVSIEKARAWGLYVSTSRGKTSAGIEEPPLFAEPGIFLVKPDATLYWASVSTMPFARPHFADIAGAIDFAVSKSYPARGEA